MQDSAAPARVLLITDAYSAWTESFLRCYLQKREVLLYLFPTARFPEDVAAYERLHGLSVVSYPIRRSLHFADKTGLARIKGYATYLAAWLRVRPQARYDAINVQFVSLGSALLAAKLKSRGTRVLLSFWGSDLFKRSRRFTRLLGLFFGRDTFFSFDSADLLTEFRRVYGRRYDARCTVARLGLPLLPLIDRAQATQTKADAKRRLGIDPDKTVIAVGYNARPYQQHEKVLSALAALPAETKRGVVILLQMTYCKDADTERYIAAVCRLAGAGGFAVRLLTEYLSDGEVVDVRLATDIYINAQVTDALSGSVCENLYCGNTLLNAAWLTYTEFTEDPPDCIPFQAFDELPGCVLTALQKGCRVDAAHNRALIYSLRSWEACAAAWDGAFDRAGIHLAGEEKQA